MSDFYDERGAPLYDTNAQGLPGDIDFYLGLAQEAHAAGHPVLELACGTGRVAIPIAREGVQVVGLDRSPAMLALACEKSVGLDNVRWVDGDMREFELPERFGLVFIPYRSFQHLLTAADQLSCLHCTHSHLAPGGRLALNIFNPDIVNMGRWLGGKRGSLQQRADYLGTGKMRVWFTNEFRPASQEVNTTFLCDELDDEGAVISRVYRGYTLRYVFRFEMEHLLRRAGFEIEALTGDFLGGPFQDSSSEMVWVARRP